MKKFLKVIVSLILLILIGSFVYLKMSTYSADKSVEQTIQQVKKDVSVKEDKHAWVIQPTTNKAKALSVIYYPGGLVEADSYLPFAINLAKEGYPVYLAKMPLNLAVISANKADELIETYGIKNFVIGGHSLGGTMASRFAHNTTNQQLKGVFFLASYPDEKGELVTKNVPVLSIKGSQDGVLNLENYETARDYLPKNTQFSLINGGNHGQFGAYGEQAGDNKASLSTDQQLTLTTDLMLNWLTTL